jgi:thiamine biosynthesis lipoprotein
MISVVNSIAIRAARLLLLFSLFIITACSERPAEHFKLTGFTMGTAYHVTVVDTDQQHPPELIQAQLDTVLEQVNQHMSTYIPESEVSMLNRVPNALPFEVDPALFDLLMQAMELSWLTNGAFDVTVGPLVNLWGFGPETSDNSVPGQAEIDAVMDRVGYQHLVLNIADTTVQKNRPVSVDLSAIAKGYGVDKVAELLRSMGYADFMVEIGGELYLSGNNPAGKPWRIAIEQPGKSPGQVHRAVNVSNAAMATSGGYRNYFEVDGRRYSHTIDPRTGRPVTHTLVSVTVIATSSAYADALATAITVMGVEQGLQLANEQGMAIYLISQTAEGVSTHYSNAFNAYLD